MTQKDWANEQVAAIGDAIRTLRGDRSAQWLSDQTEALGYKVSRSAISDIENRRRKYVTIAELTVIAWALSVPPIRLMFPAYPDGQTEILPGTHLDSFTAATWFSGEVILAPPAALEPRTDPPSKEWEAAAEKAIALYEGQKPVSLSRRRNELRRAIRLKANLIAELEKVAPSGVQAIVAQLGADQSYLEQTLKELRALPGAVIHDEPTDHEQKSPNPKSSRQQEDSRQ
ncbi:hypothetical protein ACIRRA_41985 [Nocardia sp. NPDC101769]|uniref:hypothetical protein n=1 Tax=Nocardia sp. NPDC101769 TaxID=3364333 RepID=UPI0038247749